ncbi:MAG TPA: ABC-F family ATP-binding cassette domain-containing protein [Candidatus Eremiobacteraceae bacterium]|jgi:ATP-binding cassette subfamily F protein 3
MEWLRFTDVERFYGARQVLVRASGVLRDGDKIAIVGANGSGKSTLVRILAGIDAADGGAVTRARGGRPGYVGQEALADPEARLRDIMDSAFAMVDEEERKLRALEERIADAARRRDSEAEPKHLKAYAEAREAHERHGGAGFERRMRSMLSAFGLGETDLDQPIGELSGGQRTRAAIARTLLEDPDYLILDEPTNHLDLEATRFLEDLIARDRRATIVVSHDRYFLDRVASAIWELEDGTIATYPRPDGAPAYTAYVDARRQRDEEARRVHERFVAERERQRAAIAELRTHGSHNYAQVRSREKMFARLEDPGTPKASRAPVGVRLTSSREATRGFALVANGLAKSYRERLFAGLGFEVARGERIAVVGPNGSGKSTLLKIIAGVVAPDAGSIEFASSVQPVYFSQDSAAELTAGARAVDIVSDSGRVKPQQARALLGRMGLGGELADKSVEEFSGGERRRVMLARLMTRESDCLLLDEPTNDLDIASREALENALDGFGGAMLVVSHDRYLLRRLADRVLALRDGEWTNFDGGYEAFERSLRGGSTRPVAPPAQTSTDRPSDDDVDRPLVVLSKNKRVSLERELASCEAEIERLERRCVELEAVYADPELYVDPRRVNDVRSELESVRAATKRATQAWEHLVETLGAAT